VPKYTPHQVGKFSFCEWCVVTKALMMIIVVRGGKTWWE
jgi:hypothetical protein